MKKNREKSKKPSLLFRVIKKIVYAVYIKFKIEGTENLPEEPSIIVGNHSQLHGPLLGELHFPGEPYIWCAGQMMNLKEVPAYAFEDFWSFKSKYTRPIYKIASYLIAPLAVLLFNNARTIAVYHDARLLSTFKDTVTRLNQGKNIIIYPEYNRKYNNIVYCFQDKFIDIARLYYKRTGKELSFVPFYIAPKLKKGFLGKPIRFNSSAPIDEERRRICDYLMAEITELARSLPQHTVVPYRNIPKRQYPSNKAK